MKAEVNLVVETCWCGTPHAIPETLHKFQLRQHANGEKPTGIYCPLGHVWVPSGEGRAKELERQLVKERAQHDQVKAALASAQSEAAKAKFDSERLQKRVAAGVCPCCKRTFKQLARHMACKHPTHTGGAQ